MKEAIDTRSVFRFFWQCIKPYWWGYALLVLPPLVSCVGFPLFNYGLKLLVDATHDLSTFSWQRLYTPLLLLVGCEVTIHIAWRLGEVVLWKVDPPIRKAIFCRAYDYIQHHDYVFFQNAPVGKPDKQGAATTHGL